MCIVLQVIVFRLGDYYHPIATVLKKYNLVVTMTPQMYTHYTKLAAVTIGAMTVTVHLIPSMPKYTIFIT